uniref:hypothetical protein n=1 Tax=Armatimonas sp. TaxID=1872638 RepID=UPI00286B09D8
AQPQQPPPALRFPDNFVWNPETRGPLLALSASNENSVQPATVGSLTALIPKQRTELLWEKLPAPDLFAGLGEQQKLALLKASLSEKQWAKLCSRAGLGLGDLGRDQRTLFLALLPNPLTLSRNGEAAEIKDPTRQQTRLRLSRKFTYHFTNSDGGAISVASNEPTKPSWELGISASQQVFLPGARLSGDSFVMPANIRLGFSQAEATDTLIRQPVQTLSFVTSLTDIPGVTLSQNIRRSFDLNDLSTIGSSGGTFGATFTSPRSNSSKPSQLEYASPLLDATVSLVGVKTVGELVVRCGVATKQELFCDPRYASLAVHLRGPSARAGDICQALARCVTGTWRRVGPGYVLTDDLVPLAIRMGRIHDWLTAAQQNLTKMQEGADERADAMLAAYLTWSDDDPNRPDAALATKLTPNTQALRVSELSPALREQVAKQIAFYQNNPNGDPNRAPINTDKIIYTPQTVLELLPPGYDPVPVRWASNSFRQTSRPKTDISALPEPPKNSPPRTLAVAIQNASEAQLAVATAKARGFTALWVQVGRDEVALLAAAIKAGEAEGIPVAALVRPLQAMVGTEQTVEGKRSPSYLRPDLPETQAAVLPALKKLAATPGLAGLILTDIYPTGYQRDGTTWDATLGYSESLRLACLRQRGADPVDLTHAQLQNNSMIFLGDNITFLPSFGTSFRNPSYSLPSSAWYGPSRALWDVFDTVRQVAAEAFADNLLAEMKSPAPGFFLARQSRDRRTFAPTQRCLWVPTSLWPNSIGHFLAQWHEAAREKKPPESLVFDASDRPLSQALAVLNKL